ncbi:MAG: type I restriction endonuclease subunit R [Nitrososphaerales archaeon]
MASRPEDRARQNIDKLLKSCGWKIQDYKKLDLSAGPGVALREVPLKVGNADYLLFVDRKAVGVLEAKPEGTPLTGVAEQSSDYLGGLPDNIPHLQELLPFSYESTGAATNFRDLRDPNSRSRHVFAFHRPETLKEWLSQDRTLRAKMQSSMPSIDKDGLRDCQFQAITNLEKSFADQRPRALIQMASGSGKTYTAVSFIYRLIKFANAKRVLFLVDRTALGKQTFQEFEQFVPPDDNKKFTQIYNVQHMTSNRIDTVSRVCITTIQRLYSMLSGEEEFDAELEERSFFEPGIAQEMAPKQVSYNSRIPIETFDFIVTDECHRSIYNLWSQVLEYFDAFIIGLTATPSKQTLGFFHQNLVMEYGQDRAIADRVNVGYEVYRIKTGITEKGSTVEAGWYVDKRDKMTRKTRLELLDEELTYKPNELDRSVVATDQIRTVVKTYKEKLFTEIYPSRKEVPKTLVFAKDDSHADDVVNVIREEFGKGNDFCKKITYTTFRASGEKPYDLIKSFRNSYNPRIVVTVDMVSTGTDIRPLECLFFMRDVKSQLFFEQMKGRGSRTISPDDLEAVTPDAKRKTHYTIVDAVGVCESDKTESKPLERKRSVPFDKLLLNIALGKRDDDSISSLAGRLAILSNEIGDHDREQVKKASNGKSLGELVNSLLNTVDEDVKTEKAKELFQTDSPSEQQIEDARKNLADLACSPFDKPELRNLLINLRTRAEQTIDNVSKDVLEFSGWDEKAKEKAEALITNFKKFIEDNKDELTALQIIYSKPYGKRRVTFEEIKEIAENIEKPPYSLTPELLWKAYEQLEKSKVTGAPAQKLLTNIISLIKFAVGEYEILEPFDETVNKRFKEWLESQEKEGKKFSQEQKEWLLMIKNQVAASLSIGIEDFGYEPFYEKGGLLKFYQLFGSNGNKTLQELNQVLVTR